MSDVERNVCDGVLLKTVFNGALTWLGQHEKTINQMNVFPVPDGDTGTNMWQTLHAACGAIAQLDETHAGRVANTMARGALYGARGNSGTILSMLLRGFANALTDDALIDGAQFLKACDSAVAYTYKTISSVMTPVEGTILTVARVANEAIKERAQSENDLHVLFDHLVASARIALDNTPNQLPKLKEAGVVDSGGMGLLTILEGIQRLLRGEPIESAVTVADMPKPNTWEESLVPDDEQGYGYDVQFLMMGENLDVTSVRQTIANMGWSPLVDGDDALIKVHVHVHNPAEPLNYAIGLGVQLDDIVVENMQAQYLRYVQQRKTHETAPLPQVNGVAVVAVASGMGLTKILQEYGVARVIVGGQTMNPSVDDFARAIQTLPNNEIILLPNNANVVLTAMQVGETLPNKHIRVVPSKTIPQGVASLLTYNDTRENSTLDEIANAMRDSLKSVTTLEITQADRDVPSQGVEKGMWLGLLDDEMKIASHEMLQTVTYLLGSAHADHRELLTIYWGRETTQSATQDLVNHIQAHFPNLTIETLFGGQPLYPTIMSLE
jgi:DAK2 domain fusion protein YloV